MNCVFSESSSWIVPTDEKKPIINGQTISNKVFQVLGAFKVNPCLYVKKQQF
ncbi:hypothetical protein AsFPU1_3498 [Aphanothece sacrum FPU1]|uniref:Uncharacterized protein n=1 Tax=Aphanothece sacrum FPU1 TaxID=1920663 RepID=A0A401ILE5_APHSA|nr:hypothetical protein AsFPU1_3498 [Aphanothece sacrum FPU1]GBF85006.1 hypothetical protein AsFPU3_2061 [Aphanothece sacrum FPU3]